MTKQTEECRLKDGFIDRYIVRKTEKIKTYRLQIERQPEKNYGMLKWSNLLPPGG